eukprot:Opistho-2@23441
MLDIYAQSSANTNLSPPLRIRPRMLSGPTLAGCSPSGAVAGGVPSLANFNQNFETFVSDTRSFLNDVRCHRYLLSPTLASVKSLLAESNFDGYLSVQVFDVAVAARYGLYYINGEMGDTFSGGVAGVSNTFASALWLLDTLLQSLLVGVRGARLHVSDDIYTPFSFASSAGPRLVAAKFYALLAFGYSVGRNSVLLRYSNSTSTGADVRVTAGSLTKNYAVKSYHVLDI